MQNTIAAKPSSAFKTAIDDRVRGDWSVALISVNSNLDYFAVVEPNPDLSEFITDRFRNKPELKMQCRAESNFHRKQKTVKNNSSFHQYTELLRSVFDWSPKYIKST